MIRKTLLKVEAILTGLETTGWDFTTGKREGLGSTPNGQMGTYSQGARWGSVDGKLLKRNIRGKEGSG